MMRHPKRSSLIPSLHKGFPQNFIVNFLSLLRLHEIRLYQNHFSFLKRTHTHIRLLRYLSSRAHHESNVMRNENIIISALLLT